MQIINTNLPALNTQRQLNRSQNDLQTAMQRLSSGLRVNSAKDDAAGLAIGNRMGAQIDGLNQATRNANDGVSVAQVAEGALGEVTNALQRMRVLAVQSANGNYTATDRASIQQEIEQLKNEVTRLATQTKFNGKALLDGTFTDARFQVGAYADESVDFGIAQSVKSKDLMGQAQVVTSRTRIGDFPKFEVTSNYLGDSGAVSTLSGATNDVGAQNLTITGPFGKTISPVKIAAGDSAKTIAAAVNGVSDQTGVTATAETKAVLSLLNPPAPGTYTSLSFSLQGTTITVPATGTPPAISMADIYSAIDSQASSLGLLADYSSGQITLTSLTGEDIKIGDFQFFNNSILVSGDITVTPYSSTGPQTSAILTSNTPFTDNNDSIVVGGYVKFSADGEFNITTDETSSFTILSAQTVSVTKNSITTDVSGGNNVKAQTLSIAGPWGESQVKVNEDDSAYAIAQNINAVSDKTGVTASAKTEVRISDLDSPGVVSFRLYGKNDSPVQISAKIDNKDDLTAIAAQINAQKDVTGITAGISDDKKSILLTSKDGYDIKIENFSNDTPGTQSIKVGGVKLTEGAGDSIVVGGQISFSSTGPFTVKTDTPSDSSIIDDPQGKGMKTSSLQNVAVQDIDLTTQAGSNVAIQVLDGALMVVDNVRAMLGAIQNRFTAVVSGNQATSENVSASRSRIMDADYAAETAALARAQILQQAGTAMLAQANALPQNVLQLLR